MTIETVEELELELDAYTNPQTVLILPVHYVPYRTPINLRAVLLAMVAAYIVGMFFISLTIRLAP